ncbi:MAG: carboxypeptidase-like regulatory domain-containing protein [Acidobacteriota bacterium]
MTLVVFIASIERMPTQVGRIRDASTGTPLPGVTVIRWCYGTPPFSLFDTHGPSSLRGSYVTTTTDDQGRFTLPPFRHRALRAAAWVIFKPGYMPNRFCYAEDGWEPGGCMGSGHSYGGGDPWTDLVFDRSRARLDVGIRLFAPKVQGVKQGFWNGVTDGYNLRELDPGDVDPWEQYFFRLSELVHEHLVELPVFIEEATKYVEGGGCVTADIWLHFRQRLGRLPIERVRRLQAACGVANAGCCTPDMTKWLFELGLELEVCEELAKGNALKALAILDKAEPIPERLRQWIVYTCYDDTRARGTQVKAAKRTLLEAQLTHCQESRDACTEDHVRWIKREMRISP